jgi:nucleoside-diphosphate-sugar epimerase
VSARAREHGHEVVVPRRFRVAPCAEPGWAAVRDWIAANPELYAAVRASLAGCDVLVDATGLALPGSGRAGELVAANAVHAGVLAKAAAEQGVARIVHVSSAAVQGRLDPLDETERHFPLSPYARSKAEGERLLLEADGMVPAERVVYRPASVQSPSRRTTRQLARLAALPVFAVVGDGDAPVATSLIENVAAGIVFAATMPSPPRVVLQPSDGLTARRLAELLGARRIVSMPARPARLGLRLSASVTAQSPRLTAGVRRLEALLSGQRVDAQALTSAGFTPPVGTEGWVALAQAVGRQRGGVRPTPADRAEHR